MSLCGGVYEIEGVGSWVRVYLKSGLPPDVDDMDPGVYRWMCSYHTHIDRESGHVEDYDFEVEESVLLWSPDNA